MSTPRHNPEQASGSPLYAPESAEPPGAGDSGRAGGENGAQAGAQGFRDRHRRTLVHNAITDALTQADDWVPLSTRTAATTAALAVIDQRHPDSTR